MFKPALWRVFIDPSGKSIWVTMGGPVGELPTPAFHVCGDTAVPYTIDEDGDRHWGRYRCFSPPEVAGDLAWIGGTGRELGEAEVEKLEVAGQRAWETVYGTERPAWKPRGWLDGKLVQHGEN